MTDHNAKMPARNARAKKIYFTVASNSGAGVGDQLTSFSKLYELGLLWGYPYLHTPLRAPRSMEILPVGLPWPWGGLYTRAWRFWQRHLATHSHRNIYHFLGLNQHLEQRAGQRPRIERLRAITLVLSAPMLENNNISTIEELRHYAENHIAIKSGSANRRDVLLRLRMDGSILCLANLLKSAPYSIDKPDFRAIYFEQRGKHPHRSKFPRGKLKMLVHIRLGDTAAIKTPWNTWLYYGRKTSHRWMECRDQNGFEQLTVTDFHNFVQQLLVRFSDDTFAVQFSSDGFDRAFSSLDYVVRTNRFPQVTAEKMSILNQHRSRFKREFKRLKSVKNSVSVIGETPPNLLHLVHSILTADLIIAAFPAQHHTVTNFIATHTSCDNAPPLILLCKPHAQAKLRDYLLAKPRQSEKIIPVNIAAPEVDEIITRLGKLFPTLQPRAMRADG